MNPWDKEFYSDGQGHILFREVRTGVTVWDSLATYLPEGWIAALKTLTTEERASIQELRIRRGEPLMLSTIGGVRYLSCSGLTALRQPGVWICTPAQLARCVALLCDEAVYAHQEELCQGYIALAGGIRVGIAGRAVVQGDYIRSVQEVSALCIRLPRRHRGCAAGLISFLEEQGRVCSGLLVGEPASGKTSLLRDAAALLASRHYRVTVVDERGELAGVDGLPGCEVLSGYPKAVGIRQAVRCLAPQVVVFDELGEEAEVEAVAACAHAGVAVLASLHGRDETELTLRPAVRLLLQRRMFSRWLFLAGRENPGRVKRCVCPEVIGGAVHWIPTHSGGGSGAGMVRFPPAVPPGNSFRAVGAGDGYLAPADELYGVAYADTLVGAGAER